MDRTLALFLEKLLLRTYLVEEERQAVLSLNARPERVAAHKSFVLMGDDRTSAFLVLDGLCAKVDAPSDGKRQITAFYIPGDMPDLSSIFISHAPASFEALTAALIVRLPHAQLHKMMAEYPGIAEAFCRYIVADAAITDQWVANIGGRDAQTAVAHLYCEMAVRSRAVRGNDFSFQLPATQANLGEACGLSTVHINRTLTTLRNAELLIVEKSSVHILDWKALQAAARFNDGYLMSNGPTRLAVYPRGDTAHLQIHTAQSGERATLS